MPDYQDFQAFTAPAKLNLFLHVIGHRSDGYHLLQTAFRLLDIGDTLYLKVRNDGIIQRVNEIAHVPQHQDLCIRAANLLKTYALTHLAHQTLALANLGVDIKLEKNIPMGGGLGGGSSDAATVLLALNQLWHLHLNRQTLMDLGLQLGADVPVFVFGNNAWAEGVGEQLHPINCQSNHYLIITPQVNAETAKIFSHKELTRNSIPTTIAAFSRYVVSGELVSGQKFRNDLEPIAIKLYPQIKDALSWLNQFAQAKMSGSGASVFAEFSSKEEANQVLQLKPSEYFGVVASGISQHPLYNYTTD